MMLDGGRLAQLRVVIVGLGSAGRRHAAHLSRMGVRRIEGVSEHRRLHINDVEHAVAMHHELDAALETRPDIVVVCNPSSMHAATATRALKHGAHVYLEKPAATCARDAAALCDAARASGRVVAVGYQWRFDRCLVSLRAMVERGDLGRLLSAQAIKGEYLPDYHPYEDHRQGYAARRELGGGVLLTQIHDVNYLHWLLGPFECAFASGGRTSDLTVDVEDSVSFLLRARSGCAAAVHLDYLQRRNTRRLTLAGDRATAIWDAYAGSLRLLSADGDRELGPLTPPDYGGLFVDSMVDFLTAVCGRGVPRTSLEAALQDLEVVDAVNASLASGTVAAIRCAR